MTYSHRSTVDGGSDIAPEIAKRMLLRSTPRAGASTASAW